MDKTWGWREGVTPILREWGCLSFYNGVTCSFSYHLGVQDGIPIFLADWYHLGLHF